MPTNSIMNTSVYTLTEEDTATLNTLTNTPSTGSSDLSELSDSLDANTLIFKNQPLSWWLASLNSGAVKYTPISNYVNWSYFVPSGQQYHISIEVSDLLLPNKTAGITRNPANFSFTITFEPKFGLGRTDEMDMMPRPRNSK